MYLERLCRTRSNREGMRGEKREAERGRERANLAELWQPSSPHLHIHGSICTWLCKCMQTSSQNIAKIETQDSELLLHLLRCSRMEGKNETEAVMWRARLRPRPPTILRARSDFSHYFAGKVSSTFLCSFNPTWLLPQHALYTSKSFRKFPF